MRAVLKDAELLLPIGECVAAELISPDDPRYEELRRDAYVMEDSDPVKDAELAVEFERRYRERELDQHQA